MVYGKAADCIYAWYVVCSGQYIMIYITKYMVYECGTWYMVCRYSIVYGSWYLVYVYVYMCMYADVYMHTHCIVYVMLYVYIYTY